VQPGVTHRCLPEARLGFADLQSVYGREPSGVGYPRQVRPLQHRLVDGKTAYPCVHLTYDGAGLLFDCGEGSLGPRDVHALSAVFLSHQHIDHFLGFDRLISHSIDSGGTLRVFGPGGTARRILAKLEAYTWNLLDAEALRFEVMDVERGARRTFRISVPHELELTPVAEREVGLDAPLLATTGFEVMAARLDHRSPSLAYAFREREIRNIDVAAAARAGLAPGPWMARLKECMSDPDAQVDIGDRTATVAELAHLVARRPGRSVVYATDFRFDPPNIQAVVALARGADVLYCEANFLDEEDKARESWHLTAGQAGRIAAEAGVGELVLFHLSRKYRGQEARFIVEAARHFAGSIR
jgi:ribonuclease Z